MSHSIRGIIEEVDIYKIEQSPNLLFGSSRTETQELVQSIREKGLLQPIIVRMNENNYQIVAGNRRYNACSALGWRKMLCHVVELNDKEAFEFALTENIQRETLDPLEEARAFRAYVQDYGWGGIAELSSKISKSPSYICKRLSVLNLPVEMLEAIQNSLVSPSTAEELICEHNQDKRQQIAKLVIEKRLSSRETRQLVLNMKKRPEHVERDIEEYPSYQDKIYEIDVRAQRSFDKSITALKVALSKIASVIENVEDNWIVYEILMQHKNMLNSQIDLLIKEKKKL